MLWLLPGTFSVSLRAHTHTPHKCVCYVFLFNVNSYISQYSKIDLLSLNLSMNTYAYVILTLIFSLKYSRDTGIVSNRNVFNDILREESEVTWHGDYIPTIHSRNFTMPLCPGLLGFKWPLGITLPCLIDHISSGREVCSLCWGNKSAIRHSFW